MAGGANSAPSRRAIKEERPELFATTDERRQIRLHDLRGGFVTVALANDRSESWIADRMGHTSSIMINRYERTARTFAELGLGDFDPLVDALPEPRPKAPGPPSDSVSQTGWATDCESGKKKGVPNGI